MKDGDGRVDGLLADLARTLAEARGLAARGHAAYLDDSALPLAFEALSNRIGDVAKKLVVSDPDRFHQSIWSLAARNRDFVVHQYNRVDVDLLWNTVVKDFPELARVVAHELGTP
ncbi:HepT-like ribonuclease domain-containing protein [Glaciihabitans sp. UYNi722]|uniref:HepT-like ribonuclease domain-containing protein n=1 Tax=Glaciihabitans sp. UYNi722 TaxID=3156344 RepID=UPI0033910C4D